MRIFVTGASGYIGNAVAKAFRAKGHTVYGLVRNSEDTNPLVGVEVIPVVGNLDEPDTYRAILDEIEVFVHCAFDDSDQGIEKDAKTIETVLESFKQSSLPRFFLYTSGVWVYGSAGNKVMDEYMPVAPLEIVKWRVAHEEKVLGANNDRLKTVVLRPGVVYGLSGGLTAILFESAEKGTVSIPGDGNNRWPMVHVRDLAYAYVTCAEKEIGGMILNVVDDSSVTLRELAESTARAWGLNNSISTIDPETAEKQFGSLLQGLMIDLKVDNSRIKRIGWKVHHAPFINETDIYLNAWKEHRGMQDF